MRTVFAFVALALAFGSSAIAEAAFPARYPGTLSVSVDATNVGQAIFTVKERIPLASSGPVTLLLPKWIPGHHAPNGEIEKIAGLILSAGGRELSWRRDPVDVFAFHVDAPQGSRFLDVSFRFLSATQANQGPIVSTRGALALQWHAMTLYPAGFPVRAIPVEATVTLPEGWRSATALRVARAASNTITYQPTDYATLVDSPVFAARHLQVEPLGHGVDLDIFAEDADDISAASAHLGAYREMAAQAARLFGSTPFDHYHLLLSLTDDAGTWRLEHQRSSENWVGSDFFRAWDAGLADRVLTPHEFAHAWVGKYRRPAGQAVADFRTPLDDRLLWVYEGQDQLWGFVLAARSGLLTKQETLDALARIAANLDIRRGRAWRSLEDTTLDPVITPRGPKAWLSYQRSEDYYDEGLLVWLEIDGLLRSRTGGARGLDDFARRFFARTSNDLTPRPFDFEEVVRTLDALAPGDWGGLLKRRLTEKAAGAPLEGLALGGYRLAYADTPTAFFRAHERSNGFTNLSFSGGFTVGSGGRVGGVVWDSSAFAAGLAVGDEIVAVEGRTFSAARLRGAIRDAKGVSRPIRLIVRSGSVVRDVDLHWSEGLRYPVLEKIGAGEGSLDRLLAPLP